MGISVSKVASAEVSFYPPMAKDFLQNSQKFIEQKLANTSPIEPDFQDLVKNKSNQKIDRNLLTRIIKKQYSNIKKPCKSVQENIEKLSQSNIYTITTGHQLCMYTGPLYFIYKIASVISLSKQINQKYSEFQTIPVYWMASEDHDFEEVNHFYIQNQKIEWQPTTKFKEAVGKINPSEIDNLYKQIKSQFPELSKASLDIEQFNRFYSESITLAEATRKIVNYLFGEYGIVVIDADEPELKKQFSYIIKKELQENFTFKQSNTAQEKLVNLGHSRRINPREINLFFMDSNLRERIEKVENNFKVVSTALNFSETEILNLLELNPEKFSPNVLLRPLYQETILPNIAYIGGSAEVEYWLQLKPVFDEAKIPYPAVLFRDSFFLINPKIHKKIEKLNLSLYSLFEDSSKLFTRLAVSNYSTNFDTNSAYQSVVSQLKIIIENIETIDPKLQYSGKSTLKKVENELDKLEKKRIRAIKRKSKQIELDIEQIFEKIKPQSIYQERRMNYLDGITILGKNFIQIIVENSNPLEGKIKFIY
jgi:bacillithiol biosynthesis cysteine-adding enzyme BshC